MGAGIETQGWTGHHFSSLLTPDPLTRSARAGCGQHIQHAGPSEGQAWDKVASWVVFMPGRGEGPAEICTLSHRPHSPIT